MLRTGILNPNLNSLLSRIRHTNLLVIADRGYPYWPQLETVDISLVDNIPTVVDVVRAIRVNFSIGRAWMAEEFRQHNSTETQQAFHDALGNIAVEFELHSELKRRTVGAIGLIRTADTIPYANVILESA
jgi:D-ribose pyranase